jgi:hypothetical protein
MNTRIVSTLSVILIALSPMGYAATLIGAWDFNDLSLAGDQNALPVYETTIGSQSGVGGISLDIVEATGSSEPFEINNEGTTTGDTWNAPATAGNAVGFLHGSRVDGTHVDILFDASTFSDDVTMSFAFNRADPDGVDTWQASYSTNGGTDFTNFGSSTTYTAAGWNLENVNFGTVFSGASSAVARITLSGGGPVWNEEHQSNMDNVSLTVVPEPSTFALVGLALGATLLVCRGRRG